MCVKEMQAVGTVCDSLHFWFGRGTADQSASEKQRPKRKIEKSKTFWQPGQHKDLNKKIGHPKEAPLFYQPAFTLANERKGWTN
jgi:ribosome-binding protein aMBF1 (putative translation factor)